jgi:hypothetical protein
MSMAVKEPMLPRGLGTCLYTEAFGSGLTGLDTDLGSIDRHKALGSELLQSQYPKPRSSNPLLKSINANQNNIFESK